MPRIYVPASIKNEAMKIAANIAGATTAAAATGGALYIAGHHHNAVKKALADKGHAHVAKEDHEVAPAGHVLLTQTTGPNLGGLGSF